MNKNEFLRRLEQELSVLDKEERKELLDFYKERFYNGIYYENKTEQEVCSELEPPQIIARNILEQYGVSPKKIKTPEERYEGVSLGSIIWLGIVDVMLLSWLIPTLFSVTLAMFASLFGYIPVITLIIGEKTSYDVMVFGLLTGVFILLFHFALIILDLFIWTVKKAVMFHLNTFKIKRRKDFNKKLNRIHTDGFFRKHRFLRSIKRLSFIGALVLVGIFGFRIAVNADDIIGLYVNQITMTETNNLDVTSEIDNDEVWTIVTDLDNMKIVVLPSDNNEIKLTREYQDDHADFSWSINTDTNTIYVKQDLENNWFNFNTDINLEEIMKIIKPDVITIEVPVDLELNLLDLETMNGTVDVSNITLSTLDIDTSNGAITVTDVNVEDNIEISTTNANIMVIGSEAYRLDIDTSNGRITVKQSDLLYIDIETSNGKIKLEDINVVTLNGVELKAKTSNGDISLSDVYLGIVNIKTSNGDISFYNTDQTFDIEYTKSTSNGSIEGNVN